MCSIKQSSCLISRLPAYLRIGWRSRSAAVGWRKVPRARRTRARLAGIYSYSICRQQNEKGLLAAEQKFGDGCELHVGRTFVNLADLGVAPVFFDRIVFGEAVAAVDFDSQ